VGLHVYVPATYINKAWDPAYDSYIA
jgi:hypothetical protein